ncbi:uncharacterized protein LOC111058087 isoform X1 [Nilaparvata lugens]|uniref:uncharacterized protein LOC111058087 isoform X1 n=1 Tax=Nilaparvata lugens TaxID=108931 RepID=UPI00193D124F|nr:uncharacterized protein LOC111058087 isoform X1 [Nilaparvata lugens]
MNSINKGRTKRASIDLTELLPPIELEIGRSAPKSDNSESTEDEDENDERSTRMKMGKTRTRRSVENRKMSRLLGSVDVTVHKGKSKRASIDLSDLLPPMSLKIGKSASNSGSAKSRSKRASADLSGLLPNVDLQFGKSERSVPDSPQNRESVDLSGLLPPVDLQVGKSERSVPDSPQNRESVDLSGLLPPVDLHVGKSERSVPDSPQNRASVDLSGLLPSANLQVGKSERSIPNLRQNPLAPALILYSDTKMDREVPYLQDMLRYFMKKLAKCDDDLTDEDSDLTKQTSKINLDNPLK